MKYNLGTTQIKNDSGEWKYPKGIWVCQADGNWAQVNTAWINTGDGQWERVYPLPSGIFTANTTSLVHTYYQHYGDPGAVVKITNPGDYDVVIEDIVTRDAGEYATTTTSPSNFPITITPGSSKDFRFVVSGNTVGSFSGNVTFINNVGFGKYANASIDTTVTVLKDYNGIGVYGSVPTLILYNGQDAVARNYSSYGSNTFTVPEGVTTINFEIGGGGGGGGGDDSHAGAAGYNGHKVSGKLSVNGGSTIAVHIGGGGGAGASHTWGGGGGAGGASTVGYSGGRGGNSGGAPSSGAGGGGGAATVLLVNGILTAVAAGGGGGGGGGDYSAAGGQTLLYIDASTAGIQGQDKGGDGGGGGGGGGGYHGGDGGLVMGGGDVGGYSGSDRLDLVPLGGSTSRLYNAGPRRAAGGDGYALITSSGLAITASKNIVIQNTGNGDVLGISSITAQNGYVTISNITSNKVGFNFDTYTGDTTQFTVTPFSTLAVGDYQEYITITSNSVANSTFTIPLRVSVVKATGYQKFETPGRTTWTVPSYVSRINALVVGGGGGGGIANSSAAGGGGGSGGYGYYTNMAVSPGEILTVTVGDGGSAFPDRNAQYYPVSLSYAWGSFLNTYGVWTNSDGVNPVNSTVSTSRMWTAPYTGQYTLEFSTDNYGTTYIDGTAIMSWSAYASSGTTTFNATQGNRIISFDIVNTGGPAGWAATITDQYSNIIWTTRTQLSPGQGRIGSPSTLVGGFGTYSVTGGIGGRAATTSGGAGGAGGSPNGAAGGAGGQTNTGPGGRNDMTILTGGKFSGPFGTGGAGGSPSVNAGSPGSPGAVIITW